MSNANIGTLNPNPFVPDEEQIVYTPEQLEAQKQERIRQAAPQLLAALEDLVDNGIGTEAIKRAKAAIAAARGQE